MAAVMTIKYQHQRFADAYLAHGNATQAYQDAGYKAIGRVAQAASARLLSNVIVAKYISKQQTTSAQLASINQAWVLKRLVENVERSMRAVEVLGKDGEPSGQYTYNGAVANKSLELIGQEIGMFKKQVDHSGNINHNVNSGADVLLQLVDTGKLTLDDLRQLANPDAVDVDSKAIEEPNTNTSGED